jgi:hypothetical protein
LAILRKIEAELEEIEHGQKAVLRIDDAHIAPGRQPALPDVLFEGVLQPGEAAGGSDEIVEWGIGAVIDAEDFDIKIRPFGLEFFEERLQVPKLGTASASMRLAEIESSHLQQIIAR